jgi:hypothetical protein
MANLSIFAASPSAIVTLGLEKVGVPQARVNLTLKMGNFVIIL